MTLNKVDDLDVFYLANALSPAQLRSDIVNTRNNIDIVRHFDEWPCQIIISPILCGGDEYGRQLGRWLRSDDIKGYLKGCDFDYEWWLATLRAAQKCQQANPPPISPFSTKIDIDALKDKADIVEVAERYTTLRKSGRNFVGSCPLHEDKHPSFFVYPDKQTWRCYQCNKGGDVIALVMATDNHDFLGAASVLGGN